MVIRASRPIQYAGSMVFKVSILWHFFPPQPIPSEMFENSKKSVTV